MTTNQLKYEISLASVQAQFIMHRSERTYIDKW